MAGDLPSERPTLAVDCAAFRLGERGLEVLLVERLVPPPAWALPGVILRMDESLDQAARRALEGEAGLRPDFLEQLYTFGEVSCGPQERIVTVAYLALVRLGDASARAADGARPARWVPFGEAPALPFDQGAILARALSRLRSAMRTQPIGFDLLPSKFTLTELQQLYERVLETPLDKRNFRKKALAMELLVPLDEWQQDVAHRAARLYRFDKKKFQRLEASGFRFEL